ncbi:unnamed protein product [Notodromas monacha]|uniref:Peroxidase n=1 Tax=Notodromas monacha TaxID=399045 RepID=A0A7R9BQ90_9CRUS|nr:unnamed protein product [Notodromas monacha]CAG0919666.1 unnamed protein product [Notodromas monacha]
MAELPEIMTVAGKELGRLQLADAVTQGKVSAEFQRGLRPSSSAAGLENDTDTDTYVDDVPLSPNDLFVRAKGGLDSASKLPDYSGYVVDTASCCGTLIAGLIIIVVIASKNNPNTAFDGEVNNLNKSLNANAASLQLTPEEMAELPEIMTVAGKELGRLQLADAVTQGKVSAEFQRGLRPSSSAAGLENDTDADTDTYVDDVPLSPNDLFVRAKGGLDSASKLPDYSGYVVDTASAIVTKTLGISRQEASLSSTWSSLPALRDSGDAKKVEKCSSEEKFRRIDGSCNNLANPMWGASRTGYRRSLPPAYEDGVSAVRAKASDGSALPLPRLVSRVVHGTDYREETGVNMLFVIWGQFVDHDMEFSVNMPAGIDCCNGTTMNPECIPLYIPPGDHFYDEKNITCLTLVRDTVAPQDKLVAGKELGRLQLADAVTQGKVSAEFQRGLRPSSSAAGLENDTDTDTYVDDVPLSPNDLFVRAKGGLDSASKLPDYSGYVVDTASAIVTKTLGISRQVRSDSS